MVYVVLRDHRVIQYNTGQVITVEDGCMTISTDRNGGGFLVARIPMDIVERAEFQRPCAIREEKADKRRMLKY